MPRRKPTSRRVRRRQRGLMRRLRSASRFVRTRSIGGKVGVLVDAPSDRKRVVSKAVSNRAREPPWIRARRDRGRPRSPGAGGASPFGVGGGQGARRALGGNQRPPRGERECAREISARELIFMRGEMSFAWSAVHFWGHFFFRGIESPTESGGEARKGCRLPLGVVRAYGVRGESTAAKGAWCS